VEKERREWAKVTGPFSLDSCVKKSYRDFAPATH
jgi:hypothetical protein